ncbi:MAG: diaminopimelate epimerase [Chitinophagales bacterium]|nr:diaminopimelate epimerase [Bacteroidota bacterium]
MQFNFYKYQGTGNDFVLIDNRNSFFPKENFSLVQQLCDRKFGIGADGLMLLETAEAYDFRMIYYNADGKEGTMCGNGGRCICAFAQHLKLVGESGVFIAVDGEHEYKISGNEVELKMIDVNNIHAISTEDFELFTGSPHYVRFLNDLKKLDIIKEAHQIRYNETYAKEGINVNFVEIIDNNIYMRTYERGVEDETLSCGTGTVAVALSVANKFGNKENISIQTPGGILSVSFVQNANTFSDIWLKGPATLVFSGIINV